MTRLLLITAVILTLCVVTGVFTTPRGLCVGFCR